MTLIRQIMHKLGTIFKHNLVFRAKFPAKSWSITDFFSKVYIINPGKGFTKGVHAKFNVNTQGIILVMGSANDRRRYIVTSVYHWLSPYTKWSLVSMTMLTYMMVNLHINFDSQNKGCFSQIMREGYGDVTALKMWSEVMVCIFEHQHLMQCKQSFHKTKWERTECKRQDISKIGL